MKPIQLSIGSWAYCFGPYKDNPVPFDTVIEKIGRLGFDGVELGGFTVEEPAANVSSA